MAVSGINNSLKYFVEVLNGNIFFCNSDKGKIIGKESSRQRDTQTFVEFTREFCIIRKMAYVSSECIGNIV